ncbi:MAG: ATP-binding cassette domain-containing protein [Chloroflexota bacterium]
MTKRIVLHVLHGTTVDPISDVSFSVLPRECVALVGPSGAGKSSIVKAINRTYRVQAGEILYRTAEGTITNLATTPDREILRLRRSEIGFVSQFFRPEPRVPTLEVVAMPLLRTGLGRADAQDRAVELLRALAVPERLWSSYPVLFSGGEQQRINLARALITRPRLLLADEPTSALDERNRERVVETLRSAVTSGTTIVAVFHDRALIHALASRVIVIADGKVERIATPAELNDATLIPDEVSSVA